MNTAEGKRARGRPPKITREQIIAAAKGLPPGELTMPAVAAQLGVRTPSLYHHFRNRKDLLAAMGRELADNLSIPPLTSSQWRPWVVKVSEAAVNFIVKHPQLMDVNVYEGSLALTVKFTESVLTTLRKLGFSERDAYEICNLLGNYITAEARMQIDADDLNYEAVGASYKKLLQTQGIDAPHSLKYVQFMSRRSSTANFRRNLRWIMDRLPDPDPLEQCTGLA